MKISPKQFLKDRRPEQFSDSKIIIENNLTRSMLEYHLETLGSRNQENDFEKFSKRLCENVVCPNLIPNTGPMGGGDSKVDAETYPVSDTTTLTWYMGIGNKAANERWGFAISTKEEWVSKARNDIKKIHDTNRGYKKAFFVSSRYVKSKKRAEIEDELKKMYKIDVRIFDRSWILDTIFEKKLENIAKQELNIKLPNEESFKRGPLDIGKEDKIEKLDGAIKEKISKDSITLELIDDSISAAILSRELERDNAEIKSRFEQTKKLSARCNNYRKFDILYQFAWTLYWWLEDFKLYLELYSKVEDEALKSNNVYNLERLSNLWYGYNNLYLQNNDIVDSDLFKAHTDKLKNKLKEWADKKDTMPSASLNAKTLLLMVELSQYLEDKKRVEKILTDLIDVVKESKPLIGFSSNSLIKILTENSKIFDNNPVYDKLYSTIVSLVESRDGELSSARLLLARGERFIELNRSYEAIKVLGIAVGKLYKHENRDDLVRALYLISLAYEDVGLLWASRGALLSAASLTTSELWNYGEINTMQATCYERIKWLELKLGRIPQLLEWHQLDYGMRNALIQKGYNEEKVFKNSFMFDLALGALIFNTDLNDYKSLQKLPSVLSNLGLDSSETAVIYTLGCLNELPKEFVSAIPLNELEAYMSKWINQAIDYAVIKPVYCEGDKISLLSNILGCKIKLNIENQEPCVEMGESIISALESFLSTYAMDMDMAIAKEPELEINIELLASLKKLAKFEIHDDQETPIVNISCKKFNPHSLTVDEQSEIKDFIFNIIASTIGRIVMFKDIKKDLTKVFRDERVSDRALSFTGSFIVLGNLLGYNPKIKTSNWFNGDMKEYAIKRKERLLIKSKQKEEDGESKIELDQNDRKAGNGKMPAYKHTDMKLISVIKDTFWNDAKWIGTGYYAAPNNEVKQIPPVIAILFENKEAAIKIFESWRKQFGKEDKEEKIKITIIKGISSKNPLHYRVSVGSNIKKPEKGEPQLVSSFTRSHDMIPQASTHIDNFTRAYNSFGYYLLAPGGMNDMKQPNIIFDQGIVKRKIYFKNAWEIGLNDMDCASIKPTDHPLIPPEIKNPPVAELLEILKKQ